VGEGVSACPAVGRRPGRRAHCRRGAPSGAGAAGRLPLRARLAAAAAAHLVAVPLAEPQPSRQHPPRTWPPAPSQCPALVDGAGRILATGPLAAAGGAECHVTAAAAAAERPGVVGGQHQGALDPPSHCWTSAAAERAAALTAAAPRRRPFHHRRGRWSSWASIWVGATSPAGAGAAPPPPSGAPDPPGHPWAAAASAGLRRAAEGHRPAHRPACCGLGLAETAETPPQQWTWGAEICPEELGPEGGAAAAHPPPRSWLWHPTSRRRWIGGVSRKTAAALSVASACCRCPPHRPPPVAAPEAAHPPVAAAEASHRAAAAAAVPPHLLLMPAAAVSYPMAQCSAAAAQSAALGRIRSALTARHLWRRHPE
jgi:hypothetical protein